jgi:hypothetical protein
VSLQRYPLHDCVAGVRAAARSSLMRIAVSIDAIALGRRYAAALVQMRNKPTGSELGWTASRVGFIQDKDYLEQRW